MQECDKSKIDTSDYPNDFIPNGGKLIMGIDAASKDGDCTVKGFFKDGEYQIQEVIQNPSIAP